MASADITVAKASLSATLFRADPMSCSRDDIDHFFSMLNSAINQCSPANVQKCKQWTLRNVGPSTGRLASLGKYLCALSSSFTANEAHPKPAASPFTSKTRSQYHEPSAKRKRLHILYIVNDILYHVKFRGPDVDFASKIESFLPSLIRNASAFSSCPKHIGKVRELISLWGENDYFHPATLERLRVAVEESLASDTKAQQNSISEADQAASAAKPSREAPFIMPAMHGDPSTPWYDLPAGNWLPVLEPNCTRPMNPSMIRPLQLAPGPADKALVQAVKKLMVDVDKIYAKDPTRSSDGPYDVDQIGEMVELDEISGDIINGETYYGWSRGFCEKMKSRREKANGRGNSGDRGRSSTGSPGRRVSGGRSRARSRARDYSSSRSSSRAAVKKRRLSSTSPHPRHIGSPNMSQRWSSSVDSDRHRSKPRSHSGSRSSSRSPSYSPGPSPGKEGKGDRGHEPPPPPPSHGAPPAVGNYNHFNQVPFPPPHPIPPMPHMPSMPLPHPSAFSGFPIPPVPPNCQGPWPPPPPPPPLMGGPPPPLPQQGYSPGAANNLPPRFPGVWPSVPPSVPVPVPQATLHGSRHYHNPNQNQSQGQSESQGQGQYGSYGRRGSGNFRGGGRGDYSRGGW